MSKSKKMALNIASYMFLILAAFTCGYLYLTRPNDPNGILANWAITVAIVIPVFAFALWLNWYSRRPDHVSRSEKDIKPIRGPLPPSSSWSISFNIALAFGGTIILAPVVIANVLVFEIRFLELLAIGWIIIGHIMLVALGATVQPVPNVRQLDLKGAIFVSLLAVLWPITVFRHIHKNT